MLCLAWAWHRAEVVVVWCECEDREMVSGGWRARTERWCPWGGRESRAGGGEVVV